MRRHLAIAILVGASGCEDAFPEFDFIPAYEVQYCTTYEVCASDEMLRDVGQRECLEYLRAEDYPLPPECKYDTEAAEACLAELKTAGCEGVDPAWPEVCDEVYSLCPYPRVPVVGDNRRP